MIANNKLAMPVAQVPTTGRCRPVSVLLMECHKVGLTNEMDEWNVCCKEAHQHVQRQADLCNVALKAIHSVV